MSISARRIAFTPVSVAPRSAPVGLPMTVSPNALGSSATPVAPPVADVPPWLTGTKARGLVEAARLGLPVPPAVAVRLGGTFGPSGFTSDGAATLARAVDWLEQQVRRPVGVGEAKPFLLALRCEDKRVHPELPHSLINIGLPRESTEQSERLRRERNLEFRSIVGIADREPSDLEALAPRRQIDVAFASLARILDGLGLQETGYLILQQMRFSSLNMRSAVGSAYTRHPYNGAIVDYGKYVIAETGAEAARRETRDKRDLSTLREDIPEAYSELQTAFSALEDQYRDVRYVEFVIEDTRLWILQNTRGNRTEGIFDVFGPRRSSADGVAAQ